MDAVIISLTLAVGNTFLQPLELIGFSVGEGEGPETQCVTSLRAHSAFRE